MTLATKTDSNLTGLAYAIETGLGTLAGSSADVWVEVDPNSYANFGAQLTLTPRTPINPSRMRRKGVITDLAADAGFQMDLTQATARDLLPAFFFAPFVDKYTLMPTGIASHTYTVPSGGSSLVSGDLIWASGFTQGANNGLKHVASSTGTTVVVAETLATETPSTNYSTFGNTNNGGLPYIRRVGVVGASGDITITNTGGVSSIGSTILDFTTLGIAVGEWIFVGGDATITQFGTAADNGFCRVESVAAHSIIVDKTASTWVTDAGAAKTIELFLGSFIHNQRLPANQIRQTLTWERSMSTGGYQYVEGCVASQLTITMNAASKVTCELSFTGIQTEEIEYGGGSGAKPGQRPNLSALIPAYNTTSDFGRIAVSDKVFGTNGSSLVNYLRDMTLIINNNTQPVKALGKLGAIDISIGDFNISGQMTAYFTDVATISAVKTNADVTVDFALVHGNAGMLFDVPLVALGNARANVVKDQPIELPLSHDAAWDGTFDWVLSSTVFDYLPTLAQ